MFLHLASFVLSVGLKVGADETFGSSVAPLAAFVCDDGSEIPLGNLCDGMVHCPDSSDETPRLCRRIACPAGKYRCSYGACVTRGARCDGMEDCADGSDEFRCDSDPRDICSDREFECAPLERQGGECIPLADLCNGYEDCSDGSDESASTCRDYPCPRDTFRCTYGGCVHREVLCDGIKDCVDGSDEDTATCATIDCVDEACEEFECRQDEFACGNGNQCVPDKKVCDGSRQCRDASDEEASMCRSKECPDGWFRCAYGACVRAELRCNLRPDCYDWSDEEEDLCGASLPLGACRLPAARPDSHYLVGGCPRCRPGEVVPELTRLDYLCASGATLEGASTLYCRASRWMPTVPTCQAGNSSNGITCPGLLESRGALRRCEAKWGPRQGWLPCDRSLPVGTRALLECPNFYERVSGSSGPMCLHDGTWSQPALSCKPVCGRRTTSAAALIVHGWELDPAELLPWHASLFSHEEGQWKFFCGGTLIAERIVLTAAHCVWKTSEETVRVALGLSSVELAEAGDEVQLLDVADIRLQETYQDHEGNYGSDLAILILRRAAAINSRVAPACVDLRSDLALVEARESGRLGLVVGMGLTENDTFSASLRATTVKIVPDEECRRSQKRDFRKYLTYTSFCAGWANGTAVCNGDSGGGLVLRRPNSTIWEIHGVVSLSPRRLGTGICDPRFYTVFTKVSAYGQWIGGIVESIPVLGPPDIDAHPNRDEVADNSVILMREGAEIKSIPPSVEMVPSARHDNVHITPSFIEFTEAAEGITCRQRITIKNTGSKPALVRIREPNSIAFRVKALKRGVMLNPGLSVSTSVIYTFKRPSLLRAMIPIEINGKIIDYRVVCTLATERIGIEPRAIDFGVIDVGYSSGFKIITISNEGGKSTRFSIDLGKNDLQITVKPSRGIVRPNKPVMLRVEFIGTNEGVHYSEFWIKSVPNIRVPLRANVIVPRFVLYYPNTTGDFTLLDFPRTIENTSRYDTFVLRNLSSQVASYVVLGEIGDGLKCVGDIDRQKYPVYGAFSIRPMEGRMEPFEGIVFEVGFSPTSELARSRARVGPGQRRGVDGDRERDFMVFVRIIRVHCTETEDILRVDPTKDSEEMASQKLHIREEIAIIDVSSSSSSGSSSTESGPHDSVRLCLYGQAELARLTFQPDALYFGDIPLGKLSKRVIRITNRSTSAPLTFRAARNAAARCNPECARLKPAESREVQVMVRGRESVTAFFKLRFDAIADSYESRIRRRSTKVRVKCYTVRCRANVVPEPDARSVRDLTLPVEWREKPAIQAQWEDEELLRRFLRPAKWSYERVVPCKDLALVRSPISNTLDKVLIPLSPLQIYNVHIFPTMFTFGLVALETHNYRRLIIENRNDFPVMIRLVSLTDCIRCPEGNLIILRAGHLAARLIELRADHLGKFNGYIDYVINDNHSFELSITADVVHKQLSIDAREVTLGEEWLSEEVHRPFASVVPIRNKLDVETRFKWEVPPACGFIVEPMYGSVRGNSTLYNYIYHKTGTSKAHFTEVIMKCESGSCITLRLNVPNERPKANFLNDSIDVGEIPLNLSTKVIAVLRNSEFIELVYEVDSTSLVRGCRVHLQFDACVHFSTGIRIIVQKCLQLRLKISGRVSFPRLKLSPQTIDTGRINAEALRSYRITVTNVGTTVTTLKFFLDDYPEFRISSSPNPDDPDIGPEGTSVSAGATQDLYLHFHPVDVASYAMYLPIMINDLLGPPSLDDPKSLLPLEYLKSAVEHYAALPGFALEQMPAKLPTISITCTVAGTIVLFNKSTFRFDVQTKAEQFSIENRSTVRDLRVILETGSFRVEGCPFGIEWSHGGKPTVRSTSIECGLSPGDIAFFDLDFRTKEHGPFSLEAPIFVQGVLDNDEFNRLRLYGNNAPSSLDSDTPAVYFPPVPLRTKLQEGLVLRARHFVASTIISARICMPRRQSGSYKAGSVSAVFPRGNLVEPGSYAELEVIVTFKSDAPVSVCVPIEFHDRNELVVCTVLVHATSDNNILTTHAYLRRSNKALQRTGCFDKRTSYSSHRSNSAADDEDRDERSRVRITALHDLLFRNGIDLTLLPRKQRQRSVPKISVQSYFNDREGPSLGKIAESKFWLARADRLDLGIEVTNEEDPREDARDFQRRSSEARCAIGSVSKSRRMFDKLPYVIPRFTCLLRIHYPRGKILRCREHEERADATSIAAEQWLYSHPFEFDFYPNLPEGLTAALSNLWVRKKSRSRESKKTDRAGGWTFIDVLRAIIGSSVYDRIGNPEPLPEDNVARIEHILLTYDKMIAFLLGEGACLAHVQARCLLDYDDYLISIGHAKRIAEKKKASNAGFANNEIMSCELFEACSARSWLDVILQAYKCFILGRISQDRSKGRLTTFSATSSRRSAVHRESIASSLSRFPNAYQRYSIEVTKSISSQLTACSLSKQSEFYERTVRSVMRLTAERSKGLPDSSAEEVLLLSWLQYHYEEQRLQNWMTDRRPILNPRESKDVARRRSVENFDADLSDSLVLMAVTAAHCRFLITECFANIYLCPRNYEEALHNAICTVTAWNKIRLGFPISPMQIVRPNCVQMLMLVVHLFEILPTYVPRAKVKFSCALTESTTRQLSFTNPTDRSIGYLPLFIGNHNDFFTIVNSQLTLRLKAHDSAQIRIRFHARKIRKVKAYLLLCGSAIGPHLGGNQTFVLEGFADSMTITNTYVLRSKLYQIVEKVLNIEVPYSNSAEYEIWVTEERPSKSCKAAHHFYLQSYLADRSCAYKTRTFQQISEFHDTCIGLRLIRWLMGDESDAAALEFSHIFNAKVTYRTTVAGKLDPPLVPETLTIEDVRPTHGDTTMTVHLPSCELPVQDVTLSMTSLDDKELRMYTVTFLRI
ncbi:hypothetical protein KM043_003330 [Ampulex compressa]|nr:hypothetical protein KM043_003330 [Ampulex compressa]